MRARRTLAVVAPLCAAATGCGGPTSYDLDGGDLVTVGARFVEQRGCPECHQSPDPADGTLSGQASPRPGSTAYGSNLTPDHATGLGDWADIQIVRAMRNGFDPDGAPLCPTMPRFDGSDPARAAMTDLEARAIVAYLRSLPPVTRRDGGIPGSLCPPIKPAALPDLAAAPEPGDASRAPASDLAAPVDLARPSDASDGGSGG